MKKALSLALAVVMMLAVCVPAFAADIEYAEGVETGDPAEVIIRTSDKKLDDNNNPVDARSYTVTIPADQEIPWGTESYDISYAVETHLAYGETLAVTVAGEQGYMSYSPEAGVELPLPYALLGDGVAYETTEPTVYPAETVPLSVVVTEEDWNEAVIGTYSDTLTFTAEISPAG